MLGKLFKYEFKACGRVIFPIFGAAIIMSIMAALSLAITPSKVTSTSQAVIRRVDHIGDDSFCVPAVYIHAFKLYLCNKAV